MTRLIDADALLEVMFKAEPNNLGWIFDRITNAPTIEADSGEAVAWKYTTNKVHTWITEVKPPDDAYDEGSIIPLFTSPISKEWVSLSDQQIQNLIINSDNYNKFQFIKSVEHTVKQLNAEKGWI